MNDILLLFLSTRLDYFLKTLCQITTNETDLEREIRFLKERVMRQLTNFDRLLDAKIEKFHSTIKIKPRILFILPDADHFQEFLRQKIKEKEKRDRLKKAKMIIKINAALVMTISFILIVYVMKQILTTRKKTYALKNSK